MFSRAYRLPASRPVSTQWRDRQSVTRVFQTDDIQQKAETSVNGTAPEQPQDEVSMPSNGPHPRSYAPESTEQPAAERTSVPEFELGGAVAVLMLGALGSSLKLTLDSRNGTQPLLPPSESGNDGAGPEKFVYSRSKDQEGHGLRAWWKLDTVFLVSEAPDPHDPTSASPVLIRTTHGEVLTVFQTEPAAARLVEKLIGWGQEVTVAGAAAASGNFRVAALRPSALHVQNVPPTVLIHEEQLTSNALATPEAWQEVVTAAAPEQLNAWQEHVIMSMAPVIPADAYDVSPSSSTPSEIVEDSSTIHVPPSAAERQASTPHQDSALEEEVSTSQDSETPVADERAWRQSSPDVPSAEADGAEVKQNGGSAHVGSVQDTRYSSFWTEPHAASQGESTRTPASEPNLEDMEPAVYANAEEMEEAERLKLGNDEPEQPLRLLSEDETDASLVLRDYRSLPVVFAPMLFRGSDVQGIPEDDNDTMERMLFTVDTTIDEKDPDVVALVFEDPVDATALLSILAHVQGFRDPDAVTRRVVPMPVDIATDAADWQGASLLCMAKGFQKKAEVRAGKDIDGLLSRIAGARWASLVDAQMVS